MAKIKRFGILKMALFMGLYGVLIGLIAGIFVAIFSAIFPSFFSSTTDSMGMPLYNVGFGFGWLSIILFPIIYGVGGFLSGLILTPIINLILKIIHGLDLDIEESETASTTPMKTKAIPKI